MLKYLLQLLLILCFSIKINAAIICNTSIQDCIYNASPNDTILIPDGIFYESLIIDRPLKLIALNPGNVVFDGSVNVSTNWITELQTGIVFKPVPFEVGWVMVNNSSLYKFKNKEYLSRNLLNNDYYCDLGEGFAWQNGNLFVRLNSLESIPEDIRIGRVDASAIRIVASNVYIEGIIFKSWSKSAISVFNDNVEIAHCAFSGCKFGIKADDTFKGLSMNHSLTVHHCEYNTYPVYEYYLENESYKLWKGLSDYSGNNSNLHTFFIRALANNVQVHSNYIYNSYDCLEIKGNSKREIPTDTSMVYNNTICNIVDNPFEFDSGTKETKIRAFNNIIFDSRTYVSIAPFQSSNGFVIIDHNIFFNSIGRSLKNSHLIKNCYNQSTKIEISQQNISFVHNTAILYYKDLLLSKKNRSINFFNPCNSALNGSYENCILENNIFCIKEDKAWTLGHQNNNDYLFSNYNLIAGDNILSSDYNNASVDKNLLQINDSSSIKIQYEDLNTITNKGINKDDIYFHKSIGGTELGAIENGTEWIMQPVGPSWINNSSEYKSLRTGTKLLQIEKSWLGL